MALDEELDLPRPFGPYTLVRRLAVGGMAEVYVGKAKGLGGFEKHVAIKVIHPRYSEDDHFVQMLVEEAKISVLLNHVNIAQTFDLGCIDDTYYIVMEFIEGADAYRVMRKAAEMKRAIPIDLCVHAASEICNGLDYAHRKRDGEGRPLGIVHRDISPQNILVSYAGEVKIVDFGIAKAALRGNQTEAGVIKGKYYYMSPEQAWGDPMDHRSDIFSAGVVLYELLTGRMLYNEDNVPLLLDKVRKAEIAPPEKRRPSVPKPLSDIVMKALRKEPQDRYQSAQEMSQALTQFLYAASPTFTAARLAEMMGTLFPNEVQRHSAIVTLPSVEEPLDAIAKGASEAPPPAREKNVLFDLDDESDDATRNDILPFRRSAKVAPEGKAGRITKPGDSGSADIVQSPRPTFRPPRMRIAATEDPADTTRKSPGNVDAGASDKITAPRVGPGGAWVSPVGSIDAVTTNPRRAPEDATDDNERAPEWDDPTNLKDEEWEDDQTLVDSSGLAAAIDAIAPRSPDALRAQSERGRVNVQWAGKPGARLGRSDASLPLPAVVGVPGINGKPPVPAAGAAPPQRVAPPAPQRPAPAPPPRAAAAPPPRASSASSPQWPAQSQAAPPPPSSSSSSSPGWPAQPQQPPPPSSSSSSPGWPAQQQPPPPPRAAAAPGWPAAQEQTAPTEAWQDPQDPTLQRWPAAGGASPPGPWAAPSGGWPVASSGVQPIAQGGQYATPGHVIGAPATATDPFAPPPPRPAGATGGFEPVDAGARRRTLMYAGAAALAIVSILVIALLAALGSAPAAGIEVISSPTGASVTVDGRPVQGVTPLTAHEGIESGRTHVVVVSMPGYGPETVEVTPTDGTLRQFVVLAPLPATLRVETDPPGTQVMVNGVMRGPAPLEVTGLVVGQEVEVRAIREGAVPVIRRVRLAEGTTTERILVASP